MSIFPEKQMSLAQRYQGMFSRFPVWRGGFPP